MQELSAKDMMLCDAIETAINASEKVTKLRRAVGILLILNTSLFGAVIALLIGG